MLHVLYKTFKQIAYVQETFVKGLLMCMSKVFINVVFHSLCDGTVLHMLCSQAHENERKLISHPRKQIEGNQKAVGLPISGVDHDSL